MSTQLQQKIHGHIQILRLLAKQSMYVARSGIAQPAQERQIIKPPHHILTSFCDTNNFETGFLDCDGDTTSPSKCLARSSRLPVL